MSGLNRLSVALLVAALFFNSAISFGAFAGSDAATTLGFEPFGIFQLDGPAINSEHRRPAANDVRVLGSNGKTYCLSPEPIITSEMVERAWVEYNSQLGTLAVGVQLNLEGGRRMAEYTATHIGGRMAVVLEGRVIEVPLVQAPVLGDKLVLLRDPPMSERDAQAIVKKLTAYSSVAPTSDIKLHRQPSAYPTAG